MDSELVYHMGSIYITFAWHSEIVRRMPGPGAFEFECGYKEEERLLCLLSILVMNRLYRPLGRQQSSSANMLTCTMDHRTSIAGMTTILRITA